MLDPKWNSAIKVTGKDICKMPTEKGTLNPKDKIREDNEVVLLCSVCG